MLIIADARMPESALARLEKLGELIKFSSEGITYPAISGHPDIFFCKTPKGLVYAPNTPSEVIKLLQQHGIKLLEGRQVVGSQYPETAFYNAFVNDKYWVHNSNYTDTVLSQHLQDLIPLQVKQGYTRCNLIEAGTLYITGDRGIAKVLLDYGLEVFVVEQDNILLKGCSHGFFGGCAGKFNNNLVICGSLDYVSNGNILKQELENRGINLISLYEGPLWDAGSIIFFTEAEVPEK